MSREELHLPEPARTLWTRDANRSREALMLITTTAAGGVERTRRLSPAEARERFESEGLNAALVGMRQNANEVRRSATAAAEAGRDELVLRARA